MELNQRRLFSRDSYRFDNNMLTVSSWSLLSGSREWSIRLDEIDHRYAVRTTGFMANGCLLFILILVASSLVILNTDWPIVLLAVLIVAMPLIVGRLMMRHSYIELQTKRGPVVIFNEKEKTDEFVKSLIQASRQYLIWKYGTVDADLSRAKQIENFWWLRNNGIISDDEYGMLKIKLNELQGKTKLP